MRSPGDIKDVKEKSKRLGGVIVWLLRRKKDSVKLTHKIVNFRLLVYVCVSRVETRNDLITVTEDFYLFFEPLKGGVK